MLRLRKTLFKILIVLTICFGLLISKTVVNQLSNTRAVQSK